MYSGDRVPAVGRLIFGAGRIHRLPLSSHRQRVLQTAFDSGFRDFDVAPAYGNGLNEVELGRSFGSLVKECRITTKFGIPVDLYGARNPELFLIFRTARMLSRAYGAEYARRDFSAAEMQSSLEGSLRRLRRDYVDDFMIHEPLFPLGRALINELHEKANRLRDQGKIRRWGICGDTAGMGALAEDPEFDVIQFPLGSLAAIEAASRKRRIAFGIYRRYCDTKEDGGFIAFVRSLMAADAGLDLIVSSISLPVIRSFKELF